MQLLPLLLGEHTAIRCTIRHHQCRIKVVINDIAVLYLDYPESLRWGRTATLPSNAALEHRPLAQSSITIAITIWPQKPGRLHEGASLGSKGINA